MLVQSSGEVFPASCVGEKHNEVYVFNDMAKVFASVDADDYFEISLQDHKLIATGRRVNDLLEVSVVSRGGKRSKEFGVPKIGLIIIPSVSLVDNT